MDGSHLYGYNGRRRDAAHSQMGGRLGASDNYMWSRIY